MNENVKKLSVVIPVYNDEEVIDELIRRLWPACEKICSEFEVILINDGSKDHSWEKIQAQCSRHANLIGLNLARNFGQQGALAAGLSHAKGDVIVLMDSDLQDRPEDIHLLIESMFEHKASMAVAQWESRKDTFMKQFVSRLFFVVNNRLTTLKVEPRLGIFRAMRSSITEELKNFGETTSTTVSLLYYIGTNYVCVPLKRDARFAGTSGYNLKKMLSLTLTRILSFSMTPIRIVTFSGLCISGAAILFAIFLVIRAIFGATAPGWTSIAVLITFLFGLNFAFLGIIGEYIGRIFLEAKHRPRFIVAEKIN